MDATSLQTSFLGGEWSPYAQGRADEKDYRIAMSSCFNGYPIEAGAWTRRQGTRFCATTRYGQQAWLLPFWFTASDPYTMEFTNQKLRLFNGPTLVGTNDPQAVLSISNANPAVVTLNANVPGSWSNGDMGYFIFKSGGSLEGSKTLFMRQFVIGSISGSTFTLTDPITNTGIDGSTITIAPNVAQFVHVQELASPYLTTQLTGVNKVQTDGSLVALHPLYAPQALVETSNPGLAAFAQFTFGAATFQDGPYFDPNTSGTITPSALSGTITLSSAPANTFAATDVGRQIRLFSEPAAWASGTGYVTGNIVKYTDGLYYQALANSTGSTPPQNPTLWANTTTAAIWTWATIATYVSGTSVTATINGPALLYTTAINSFRLGLYSNTTGYPTCGIWHEGRLWLAGAQTNRIDGSAIVGGLAAGTFNFSPTESDGTVTDASAISYTFNADDTNTIYAMSPNNGGIMCVTKGGEWIVAASNLTDPLTPTSIQAHRRSRYKGANVQPVNPGISTIFVQAEQQKLIEYTADTFSGKFLGRNLSSAAKHLSDGGIVQLAYQQELAPIVWARTQNGSLIGTTYKRESAFTQEPPTFNAWHRHALGSNRIVESMSVGPSVNGTLESLTISTNQTDPTQPDYNIRHVEILTNMFDENNIITDAWFVDDGLTPSAAQENSGATSITFYGYYHLIGKTVSGWIGGVDAGDAVVQSDGSVSYPINAAGSLLTDAYLSGLSSTTNFDGLGTYLDRTVNVQYPVGSGNLIQSYVATNTPNTFMDDYFNNRVFSIKRGASGTSSIAMFNRLTGVKQYEKADTTIFTGVLSGSGISPAGDVVLGKDGYLYFGTQVSNLTPIAKVNAATGAVVGTFGLSASLPPIGNQYAIPIQDGVVANVSGHNWLVYFGFSSSQLNVIDADNMIWGGHSFNYPSNYTRINIVQGETIDAGKNPYTAIYSVVGSPSGNQANFYKTVIVGPVANNYYNPPTTTGTPATIQNPGITTTNLFNLAASTVDATWTDFTGFFGPTYDPADGNLICIVSTIGASTNSYIIKVNAITGAIIWKTAATFPGMNNRGMARSNVAGGTFAFMTESSNASLQYVNTSTGVVGSATSLPSVNAITTDGSISMPNDGSILNIGTWSGATLTGVNGTVAFGSNTVFKIQGFTGFPGSTTETRAIVIPAVIGFTYASNGATLRAIAPDASGARNGPALGKTRRNHRISAVLANAQGISFGTDLTSGVFHLAQLKTNSGKGSAALNANVLYTGVFSDTFESTYDYDNAPAWQITRPYPATVCAVQAFLHTQDR